MPLESVAIDGKAVRGAKAQNLPCTHLLSAFGAKSEMVLAQVAVGSKANEITQALPLLKQLYLEAKVVTGDAIFTQRSICQEIIKQGGNYLLEVKDNQSELKVAIAQRFFGGSISSTGLRRVSKLMAVMRFALSIPKPPTPEQPRWPSARQVCRLACQARRNGKWQVQVYYKITSLTPAQAGAKDLLNLSRTH